MCIHARLGLEVGAAAADAVKQEERAGVAEAEDGARALERVQHERAHAGRRLPRRVLEHQRDRARHAPIRSRVGARQPRVQPRRVDEAPALGGALAVHPILSHRLQ